MSFQRRRAKFSGVLPPSTLPDFSITSTPLWEPNFYDAAGDPENDPVAGSSPAQSRIYHFATTGNAYMRQRWASPLQWQPHTTPAQAGVLAFKALVKPTAIHGRRLLYSTKDSLRSGGLFVDMVDGKIRMGWYDTVQKREVWIGTNIPVFDINHWHYVYARKRFPDPTLGSGAWQDSIIDLTATSTNDVLMVRRFRKEAAVAHLQKPWDYTPHDPAHASGVTFQRNCVGFTTDLEYSLSGATATGLVSRTDRTFSGGPGGAIGASAAIFSPDMVGKYLQITTGALPGLYVISNVTTTTNATLIDPITGNATNLGAILNDSGAVYHGVKLVKSDGFDESQDPDQTSYDVELFGSHLAGDPESGILPFVGKIGGFVYGGFTGANPNIFEATTADKACDGTDGFVAAQIYFASPGPDELRCDQVTNRAFTAVNTQSYTPGEDPTSTIPVQSLEVAVDAAPASHAMAQPLTWQFLENPIDLSRPRKVRTAFYDPDQGQVSNPGPELLIHPGGDDGSNPSGATSIILTELPVSADKGEIETRVYMTQADGETYYLVAEAPFGASSVAVAKSDAEIGRGEALDFDNWAPPDCNVIEVSQDTLACGNLRRLVNDDSGKSQDLPDAVFYSKPFNPVAFPAGNLLTVPDASRAGVTGLRELNGRLIVAKRDSLYRAWLRQGLPQAEIVSPKIGASSGAALVAHDGLCVFRGKRGVYVFHESGLPQWAAAKVRLLFEEGLEPGEALQSVGAVNPRRNQVVFTMRELDAEFTSHRLSVEPTNPGVRFARYESPNLTALADLATADAEIGEFVGGTAEGFFVWLDRRDTHRVLLGDTEAIWGDDTHLALSCCEEIKVRVDGLLDLSLAGPRGAAIRWGSTEAIILFVDGDTVYLDKAVDTAAVTGQTVTIGLPTRYWTTKWLDLGDPEFRKKARYLDVVTTIESGSLSVRAYMDYGSQEWLLSQDTQAVESAVDLGAAAVTRFDIGHLNARHYKFRFQSTVPFEIVSLVVRVSDADAY